MSLVPTPDDRTVFDPQPVLFSRKGRPLITGYEG